MPHQCDYCKSDFSHRSSLVKHQATAEYCLGIQGKTDEVKNIQEKNRCPCCSRTDSNSSRLKKHVSTCTISQNAVSITNIQNQNIQNNTIQHATFNINLTGYSMSDLTQDHITRVLKPLITKEVVQAGLGAITDVIVDALLQRDGRHIYYCSDAARKKFMMIVNHEGTLMEKYDPESLRLRTAISGPLMRLVQPLALKHDEDKSIQATMGHVENLRMEPDTFNRDLITLLPSSAEGVPEGLRLVIDEALEADTAARKELVVWKRAQARKKASKRTEKTAASTEELLRACEKRADGLYWHNTRHWIVQLGKGAEYEIIGYAPKKADKPVNLTKAQLQAVRDMGLGGRLHGQYLV